MEALQQDFMKYVESIFAGEKKKTAEAFGDIFELMEIISFSRVFTERTVQLLQLFSAFRFRK